MGKWGEDNRRDGGEGNERKQKKTSRVVCEFCVVENCGVETEEKRREGKKEERGCQPGIGNVDCVWPCAEPTRHWIDVAGLVIYQAPHSLPPPGESIYGNSSDGRCCCRLSLHIMYDIPRGKQHCALEATI